MRKGFTTQSKDLNSHTAKYCKTVVSEQQNWTQKYSSSKNYYLIM